MGLVVERQRIMPLHYGGVVVDAGYRVDLLVQSALVVAVKSVRAFAPIHDAQLLKYLELAGLHLGLLLNFNVRRLADGGIRRLVSGDPPR